MSNTADIIFRGVDKVSDVIKNIKQNTNDLNSETNTSGAITSQITKQMAMQWLKVSAVVSAVVVGVKKLTNVMDEGMRLRLETEGAEKTLAGLIGTFYDFRNSFGDLADESTKFNLALNESKKLMGEIDKISAKTGVAKKELTEAVLAGISAGAGNFSNEEILNIAGKVAATGNMIGLNSSQLRSELKAILSGNINNNSDVGGMLGLKGDELYKEALKAGKGFEYLSEKFKSIDKAIEESSQSVGAYFNQLDAFTANFKTAISEDYTKSFKDLRFILSDLTDDMGNFSTPVQGVVDFLNSLGGALGSVFSEFRQTGMGVLESIGRFLSDNSQHVKAFADLISSSFGFIMSIIRELGQVFFDLLGAVTSVVNTIANGLATSVEEGGKKFEGLSSIIKMLAISLDFASLGITVIGDSISGVINWVKQFVLQLELATAKLKGFFTDTTTTQERIKQQLEELKNVEIFKNSDRKVLELKTKLTTDTAEAKNQLDELNQYQKTAIQQNADEDLKARLEVIKQVSDYQKQLLQRESVKIDIDYQFSKDKDSDSYYATKIEQAKKIADVELEGLRKVLELEKDTNKQEVIRQQMTLKELDLRNELTRLEGQRAKDAEDRAKKEISNAQTVANLDLEVEKKRLQNQLDDVSRLESEKVLEVNVAHSKRIEILTALHNLEQNALQQELSLETDKIRILQIQNKIKLNDLNFNNQLLNLESKLNLSNASAIQSKADKQKEFNALLLEQKRILIDNQAKTLELDKEEGTISLSNYYTAKIELIKKSYDLEISEIRQQMRLVKDEVELKKLGNQLLEKELSTNNEIRQVLNDKKNALIDYKNELLSIQQELGKNSTGLGSIDLVGQSLENSIGRDLSKYDENDRKMVENHLRTKAALEQIAILKENINALSEQENTLKDSYLRSLASGKISLEEYNKMIQKNSAEFSQQLEEQKAKLEEFTQGEYAINIKIKAMEGLNLNSEELKEYKALMSEVDSLVDGMRDTFSNTFSEIMQGQKGVKDGMKEMFNSMIGEIHSFISKQIGKQLFDSLFGSLFNAQGQGGGSIFGDFIGGLFGGSGGQSSGVSGFLSQLGRLFGGARASGGLVQAGVPYMVGEAGREIFIPQTNGRVLNNSQTEGVVNNQSSSVVYNNYTIKTRPRDSFNSSKLNDASLLRQVFEDSKRNI